jgi:hypothetical protein
VKEIMREELIAKLKFSPWYKWENKSKYDKKYCPGIYLLAITTKDLEGTKPKWTDVVYIGRTTSKGGLTSRWQQFASSTRGKGGHSGGYTIYEHLGHYKKWRKTLYVSAMGIKCDVTSQKPNDYRKMGWIAFLEYDAFAKYARAVGGHPKYNTQ